MLARLIAVCLAAVLAGCASTPHSGPNHGLYTRGAVAADQRLASQAGARMLELGGNAVDAAVAASFTLSVARPYSCGIGGGGFMVIHLPDDPTHGAVHSAINYRETAYVDAAYFQRTGKSSTIGGAAVATPGTVAGLLHALETYGTLYSGLPFPNQGEDGRHVLHTAPLHAWLPSAGVSALAAIDGFHPTWDGDLLAGSLSSPEHGQSLFRIRIEDGHVVFAERIRLDARIRYVTQWGPDRIAVLIDHRNAVVVFRAQERVDVLGRALATLEARTDADLFAQVAQATRTCNECHSFERNAQGAGPSLAGVVGREIGGAYFDNYSSAMASHGGVWDRESLARYIVDPQSVVPGTTMAAQGLEPGPVVEGLIDLLEIAGEQAEGDMPYN